MQLRIGDFLPAAPVVLAPMAGVTNAPFRALCRRFAPGLVYVNEMVMCTALVQGNPKTQRMVTFGPDERPRSLQLYGSDPAMMRLAVAKLCDEGRVDHLDLNFGCPAAKVTRRGGGAAVPAKPALLEAIVRAAVTAAAPCGVPVTAKFRIGLTDDLLTYLRAGTICEAEGVAWVALHARTAEQHYAGDARWDTIAELKAHVTSIPVLGNGDIWVADDAVAMLRHTGCDGVVVGRGCLGQPWLFGDLVDVFAGRRPRGPRPLGEVIDVMAAHAIDLVEHYRVGASEARAGQPSDRQGAGWRWSPGAQPPSNAEHTAMRDFRKHTAWYFTGYPVGPESRRRGATVSTLAELDDLLAGLDRSLTIVDRGERIRRGHTNGPIKVALPDGFLADRAALEHDLTVPGDRDVMALSGG